MKQYYLQYYEKWQVGDINSRLECSIQIPVLSVIQIPSVLNFKTGLSTSFSIHYYNIFCSTNEILLNNYNKLINFFSVYSIATAQLEKTMTLSDVFGNADILRENNMFDSLLKGLSIQPAQTFDNAFANSVSCIICSVCSNLRRFRVIHRMGDQGLYEHADNRDTS